MDVFDLGRARGGLDGYDGVEIPLRGGKSVRVNALSVEEAMRYLRLVGKSQDDPSALASFLAEILSRFEIGGVSLSDIGVDVDGPDGEPLDLGRVKLGDIDGIATLLGFAGYDEDERRQARAQYAILRRIPRKVGLDPEAVSPPEVFAVAKAIVEAAYERVYGLAMDFCSRQIFGPRTLATTSERASESYPRSSSVSTT